MKLREEYKKELDDLKDKMIEAQKFAEKFPQFSERILEHKFTKEFTGKIQDTYKGLYCAWGINRYFYREKGNITNYRGDFEPKYLWVVYINECSLFGDHYTNTGIHDINNKVKFFFYDAMNTTFYATDDQVVQMMDALSEWYAEARVVNEKFRNEKKKLDLLAQLEKLA